MATNLDPQRAELHALFGAANFGTARVLEIGSGDGRLAFRYADTSPLVVGIDEQDEELASARRNRPARLATRLRFVRASAEALPFRGDVFDIGLFAWSL